MNLVYIPYNIGDEETFNIIMDMITILYGKHPKRSTIVYENSPILYWSVEVNKQLGKKPLVELFRYLDQEFMLFKKGNKLFKKYIDTGIVELIGENL